MNLWFSALVITSVVHSALGRAEVIDSLFQQSPVPNADQQKAEEKSVREVFKDEFAKTSPTDRLALVKKLIEQSLETKDDPPVRYVLLREARDLAAALGNADLAFRAI